MAGIETHSKGRRRMTRPDMTALVDVAFLLLMFFVLTAAMIKPKAMNMTLPAEGGQPVNCKKVLTLYLGDNNRIYALLPCSDKPVETSWAPDGLRKMLLDSKISVNDLIVVCKPGDLCTYMNVVDAMDEFAITGLKKYALADVTEEDIDFLKQNQIQIN